MNTMSHRGYSAVIQYDDEDGLFFGRLAGIRDGVGFHGQTVDELRAAFHEAVEDYNRHLRQDRQVAPEALFRPDHGAGRPAGACRRRPGRGAFGQEPGEMDRGKAARRGDAGGEGGVDRLALRSMRPHDDVGLR